MSCTKPEIPRGKSIKRRAPPPPQRTVSEVYIPTVEQPAAIVSPEPEPTPQPARTYTTVNKTTRLQPKRCAPPPPMSRRNTAPVLSRKDRTIEQISNLEDTSDSSGGGMLPILPENRIESVEENPKYPEPSENRDVLELSSNLDDVDLLGSFPADEQETKTLPTAFERSYDNIPPPNPTPPEPILEVPPPVSELNMPNPVPVPIPLKSSLPPRPDSPESENEPYYEVIDSDTSSEYNSLPPPPAEVLAPREITGSEELFTPPADVFLSPAQSLSEPFEDVVVPDGVPQRPNTFVHPSNNQASSENVFRDNNPTKVELPPPEIPHSASQDTRSTKTVSPPALPNIYARSTSVSTPPNSSNIEPSVPRSASVSVPANTQSSSPTTSVRSVPKPPAAASRNTGPAIPSSPLPKQPSKTQEKYVIL